MLNLGVLAEGGGRLPEGAFSLPGIEGEPQESRMKNVTESGTLI